jgi:hypothetical protein
MVRVGVPGETLTATEDFIDLRTSEFQTTGENVRMCERVRLKGDFEGSQRSGLSGCADWWARRQRFWVVLSQPEAAHYGRIKNR